MKATKRKASKCNFTQVIVTIPSSVSISSIDPSFLFPTDGGSKAVTDVADPTPWANDWVVRSGEESDDCATNGDEVYCDDDEQCITSDNGLRLFLGGTFGYNGSDDGAFLSYRIKNEYNG